MRHSAEIKANSDVFMDGVLVYDSCSPALCSMEPVSDVSFEADGQIRVEVNILGQVTVFKITPSSQEQTQESIDSAMKMIYQTGLMDGRCDNQQQIRKAIGLS